MARSARRGRVIARLHRRLLRLVGRARVGSTGSGWVSAMTSVATLASTTTSGPPSTSHTMP